MGSINPHQFTTPNSFTKGVYRDVYPAVDPRNPENSAAGKVVLITGSSRGIGKGVAEAFALAGARAVIITARKLETLKDTEAVVNAANASTEVLAVSLELGSEVSIVTAFKTIAEHYSKIDVLVNNAGIFGSADQMLGSADNAKWWADFEINVRGTMIVTKSFISHNGPGYPASVVYISSGLGLLVVPGASAYSITKLADMQMAAYTAAENPNLQVVALHPGIVATDIQSEFWKPYALDTAALAGANVVFLSGKRAAFMSGRYTSTNWDVSEMIERKDEILKNDLLKVKMSGLRAEEAVMLG